MKEMKEILSPSFKDFKIQHSTSIFWKRCLAINSQFCEAVVKAGYLSWEQMVSAACRYRLGATRQGGRSLETRRCHLLAD